MTAISTHSVSSRRPPLGLMSRRRVVASLCAMPTLGGVSLAQGHWPSQAVRIVLGQPAGSGSDPMARGLAPHFASAFGQPFVVENMPGAGGTAAAATVARATDGHTLGIVLGGPTTTAKAMNPNLPYDPRTAFQPISLLNRSSFVLTAHAASFPGARFADVVDYARAHPGKLSYASIGPGTVTHLAMEELKATLDLDIVHVPYRGFPQASLDLTAGRCQLMFNIATAAAEHIAAGSLIGVAQTGATRMSLLPDVPTLSELKAPTAPLWNGPPLSSRLIELQRESGMKDIQILGVDLGKNSCSVVGLDPSGRVLLRRRMRREGVVALAAKLPGCVVAMEACCGAHHLGRLLVAQGHEVRLMSPEYVRPYVKAQKNDDRDAEAIAEAATRPTMRFVALKIEAQLDVQVLHRVRDRLVGQRTSLMNQIRSILLERGIVVPQGRRSLLDALAALLSEPDGGGVGARVRRLLDDMLEQWRALDERIKAFDDEFAEMARNDPAARRLATIPGIGVMNATALVAAIGDGVTFNRGRDLSAWLGLVPRQATTGGKPKLLGITKRGSKYLRKLVIQGARAALPTLAKTATPLGDWLRRLLARAHCNTVVVALASKLVRIAWALLRNQTTFGDSGRAAA